MMHGMTGTAEMMRPFAEKILPDGLTLLVPDARFKHPVERHGRYDDENLMSHGGCNFLGKNSWMSIHPCHNWKNSLQKKHRWGLSSSAVFLKAEQWRKKCCNSSRASNRRNCGVRTDWFAQWSCLRLEELDEKRMFWMHGVRDACSNRRRMGCCSLV